MKVKLLFLVSLFSLALYSCKDSEEASLQLSASSFEPISSSGATLEVTIYSDSEWIVSNPVKWCTVTPLKGSGNQKLTLQIDANPDKTPRTGTIMVSLPSNGESQTIALHQEGEPHYALPVIFHVLYKDRTDDLQYVSPSRLSDILTVVNGLYRDNFSRVDMNLTFALATTDPAGKAMMTPGVEYVQWPEAYPIDCYSFMVDNSGKYVKYIWDPNTYINVMLYNFTSDDSGSTTLGVSHLPFSTKGTTFLAGLNPVESSYLTLENLRFPYCLSINSLYIDQQSTDYSYNTADITVTLAHELGHYLGLHHVFFEADNEDLPHTCEDTDYCEDTPTYNRQEYDALCDYTASYDPDNFTFEYLVKRTSCSGTRFISHNIMDYSISYSDQFTPDQRARVRHVLTNSPLIPGPKEGSLRTRSAYDGPMDLPILVIK